MRIILKTSHWISDVIQEKRAKTEWTLPAIGEGFYSKHIPSQNTPIWDTLCSRTTRIGQNKLSRDGCHRKKGYHWNLSESESHSLAFHDSHRSKSGECTLVRTKSEISFHGSSQSPVGVVFYRSNMRFPWNTVYCSADYSSMFQKRLRMFVILLINQEIS